MTDHHQSPGLGGGRGNSRGKGRKRGINNGPPPKVTDASTFDWDGQRDRYWRTLDWQAWVMRSPNRDARVHLLRMQGKKQEAQAAAAQRPKPKTQPKIKKQNQIHMTPEQVLEVRRRYEAGETVGQIAKAMGRSDAGITNQLKKAGIYQPGRDAHKNKHGTPPKISEDQLPELARQYLEGRTCADLMVVWRVATKETIIKALRRAGVYQPDRDKGKWRGLRIKVCRKGLHSMDKYGRPVNSANPDGPKYCYACSRIRNLGDSAVADQFDPVDNTHEN